ncbi:MAG: response regulator transcription factor [Muribaculaceae bacterium]|nr:response regulator transcription factor [Muribaculaceae bacterium]MBR1550745.1 response regulator transcription factor [Muribaculaceae bacterium]
MIRCIAIDDEPLALQQLASYVKKVSYLELIGQCQSAIEARELLEKEQVDAIFIDINMPDLNGLDFVRSLENPPLVVFTTAYSEYAVEGFKANAIDYLLKPFDLNEFRRAAEKLKTQFELLNAAQVSQVDEDDAMFLKSEYKVVRVNIKDIRYIEAMSEYLRIYTTTLSRPVIVLLSMKKMEERLPSAQFMRIHRSYIVNLKKIREVSKNHVTIDADTSLPIGDIYKETFNAYIASKFLTR